MNSSDGWHWAIETNACNNDKYKGKKGKVAAGRRTRSNCWSRRENRRKWWWTVCICGLAVVVQRTEFRVFTNKAACLFCGVVPSLG